MSSTEDQDRAPLLEKSRAPRSLLRFEFSRSATTITAVATQAVLCILLWVFVITMTVKKVIPLQDNVAKWIRENQSETNLLLTMASTVLGLIGSSLLGITIQHALTFRLPRGVRLSIVTAWIHFAKNVLFFRPRRHLWWTLLSVLWVVTIHFLTTAWSNLLTPETVVVVQNIIRPGWQFDLLSPALSEFGINANILRTPLIEPNTQDYFLDVVKVFNTLNPSTTELSQAGRSAVIASLSNDTVLGPLGFNSSTGGVDPTSLIFGVPAPPKNYQGLSTSFTFVQQGYTANVSCMTSSSPVVTLYSEALVNYKFQTPSPSGHFGYTIESWSWRANCSRNRFPYTGVVNTLGVNDSLVQATGIGLFAVSVCFYQDFSGPSNQSFLLLMQIPNSSLYNQSFSVANLPTVCQFTPMVSTVEVQYDENGIANINNVLDQYPLPDHCWPWLSIQGLLFWTSFFLAQGPFSNSLADDIVDVAITMNFTLHNGDIMPALEHYLQGVFEFIGTLLRFLISANMSAYEFPGNMTIPLSGTRNVQTIGWTFHLHTHGASLAVITLITVVTTASGAYALLEASRQKVIHNSLQKGDADKFDPTNLMDILLASSMGSLANVLSQSAEEERHEKLMVGLAVTNGGQPVLNIHADDTCVASKDDLESAVEV